MPATVRSTAPGGDVILVSDDGVSFSVPRAVVSASVFRLLRVGQRLAVAFEAGAPVSIHLPGDHPRDLRD